MRFLLESPLNFQGENIVSSFGDVHETTRGSSEYDLAHCADRTQQHESSAGCLHNTHPHRISRKPIHGFWTHR